MGCFTSQKLFFERGMVPILITGRTPSPKQLTVIPK